MATWFEGLEAETIGHIQNRGWDKLEAPAATAEIYTAYREAEKKLGIPADKVLRMPEPTDVEGVKAFHQRLGVPATAADYDFSTITTAPEGLVDAMRATALELNIPKDAAPKIVDAFLKFGETAKAGEAARTAAATQVAHDALAASWGANADTNKFIADRAAAMLGITPEQMDGLKAASSYGTVMQGLLTIGQKMGEAKLISPLGGGGPGQVFTREQALAKREELMNDREWVRLWGTGNKAAMDELGNLNRLIVGPPR